MAAITQPDGSAINYSYSYSYNGNQAYFTTVTDEAGNVKVTQTNGLGLLMNVWEDPNTLNYNTVYAYDGLGNLESVLQSLSRPRSFTHDSLSRLITATNPETGTVTYGYDNNGTLTSRTDNRQITTQYTPDPLHRITKKHYINDPNNDPDVNNCYGGNETNCPGTVTFQNNNPVGRRTGMSDASGATSWAYDPMGRATSINETVNQTNGSISTQPTYTYNLDGSLAVVSLPNDSGMSYSYTNAGRVSQGYYYNSLLDNYFVDNATYTPSGALAGYVDTNFGGPLDTVYSHLQ